MVADIEELEQMHLHVRRLNAIKSVNVNER